VEKPTAEPKKWTVKYALWVCCFIIPPVVVLPIVVYKHYTTGLQPGWSLENIIFFIILIGWIVLLYVNANIQKDKVNSNGMISDFKMGSKFYNSLS